MIHMDMSTYEVVRIRRILIQCRDEEDLVLSFGRLLRKHALFKTCFYVVV